MSQSIIKSSNIIRQHIKTRIKELNLTYDKIVTEAQLHGMRFTKPSLSRYLNAKGQAVGMGEQDIIYLAMILGLNIKLVVRLNPYDEAQCMENVKYFFK